MTDKKKCGAKTRKAGGLPCALSPMPGTTRCYYHGGKAPQVQAAAKRRQQEALAVEAVKTYGLPADVSPVEALLNEVKWTAGHVAWLREQVQAVEHDALIWGKTKQEDHGATEFPGVNVTEQAVSNVWLDLYQKERQHLLKVCATAIQCGIEERKVRLAESQGAVIASLIQAILGDLNLSPEQAALVPTVVPRHLRAVAG